MKNIYIALFIILIVTPLVIAEETYTINKKVDLKIPFEVDGEAASSSASCNISIINPNSTYITNSSQMTNQDNGEFNFTLGFDEVTKSGLYKWNMYCCDSDKCASGFGDFDITKTGTRLNSSITSVYAISLILLIFLFIANLVLIHVLPSRDTHDENGAILEISNLKHLRTVLYAVGWGLVLSMLFVIGNMTLMYLPDDMLGNLFMNFFLALGWLTLPMIVLLFIYIFVKMFKEKEIKNLIERGVRTKDF